MPRRPRRSPWTTRSEQVVSSHWKPRRLLAPVLGVVGAAVLLAGARWLWSVQDGSGASEQVYELRPPQEAQPQPQARRVPEPPPEGSMPPVPPEVRVGAPMTREQAAAEAEKRNRQNTEHLERFLADGWELSDAAPPDLGVVALDPGLLPERERDLRVQLETNAIGEAQLENVRDIALAAQEERTRFAAIQALGRSDSERAQELLTDLFDEVSTLVERRMILGFVRPGSLDDPSVDWLIGKLGAPELSFELKKQMTFSLVLAEIAQAQGKHGEELARLVERVPPEWQQEVVDTYRTVTRN
jgi:hypothetical protein